MQSLVELIAQKRDGKALAPEDVRRLISAFTAGELADYQMSAFLMAVVLRGMSDAETVALTEAMLHSGDVLDLSGVPGFKVDKHSTGGVGDKVSICLAPIVASLGARVPMVSGRGLGHTGGTLDKLEAIPGFSVNLDTDAFRRIVADVGACMIGQTARIAPADKRIYALRDVTATVESIPLIVASILSKKLAEGIDGLVLDVKVGRGAFMKTIEAARELATALTRVGNASGKKTVALLTDMDAPLGRTIGNANETREAIDVLHGGGPADLVACTVALAEEMLAQAFPDRDGPTIARDVRETIASGRAARSFERMIEAQGGDPSVVEKPERLALAPDESVVVAARSGVVVGIDALELGLSAVAMGAGRTRAEQPVDHGVGIELDVHLGTPVRAGEPLCRVRTRAPAPDVLARIGAAFAIGDEAPARRSLVLERIA